jgi:uncharacterized LabA/DUF88 family protein
MDQPAAQAPPDIRVRVFVDFWNFQLNLKQRKPDLQIDWKQLGPWMARQAGAVIASLPGRVVYEGLHLYISHDPNKTKDDGLRRWAVNTLDRFPGVNVVLKERKPKRPPSCPTCHESVETCPKCAATMRGTEEKGIDTALVTDMIRLAWENSWDVAVLVSGDRDFIPAVEYLEQKGRKVIHGGFPPSSMELSRKCWGSFNILDKIDEISRPNDSSKPSKY